MTSVRICALASAALLAACSDARPLKVGARTDAPAGTTTTPPPPANPAGDVEGTLDLGNGIALGELLLGVRKIEATDGDASTKCGPFGIRLAGAAFATGQVVWQFECLLDQGNYESLLVLVDTLPFTHVGDDAVLKALDDAHASFLARGTIDGEPFTFSGPLALVQHGAAFTIGDGGGWAQFVIDPTGWFDDGAGNRLDPRDATLRDEILANVRDSIRLER